ncbi:unnamed protein product, partial [Ectocarpus fasciculatus]
RFSSSLAAENIIITIAGAYSTPYALPVATTRCLQRSRRPVHVLPDGAADPDPGHALDLASRPSPPARPVCSFEPGVAPGGPKIEVTTPSATPEPARRRAVVDVVDRRAEALLLFPRGASTVVVVVAA